MGRREYVAAVRHKNVLLCVMSQLAFYFFYRWNIVREETPRFQQRQQWYLHHLLRGDHIARPLSYAVQLQWTNRVFQTTNVSTLKKTHAGRGGGANEAIESGASEGHVRRAGRWNNDAMSQSYLTHLPLEFVRVMAGFKPTPGDFYIPRAKVQLPESLVRAVWPWIDQWLSWFDRNFDVKALDGTPYGAPPLLDVPSAKEDRLDLAAQGFLRLMLVLRTIFLQDSVLLRREFPAHPMWEDALFGRDDYLRFAEEVKLSLTDLEEPDEIRLRRIVPDIASRLNASREEIVQTVETHGDRNHRLLQSVHDRLEDLFSGRVSVTFHGPEALTESSGQDRTQGTDPPMPMPMQDILIS